MGVMYGRVPTYWAVAAHNTKAANTTFRELALWQQGRAVYIEGII